MPTTKLVKDLNIGDRVHISEPEGTAIIQLKERSRLFQASGGCFRLDMQLDTGPHKGEWIKDQHHGGDEEIVMAERAALKE